MILGTLPTPNISISIRASPRLFSDELKVGTFFFPADFVVVDYVADPQAPMFLRKTFLEDGTCLNRCSRIPPDLNSKDYSIHLRISGYFQIPIEPNLIKRRLPFTCHYGDICLSSPCLLGYAIAPGTFQGVWLQSFTIMIEKKPWKFFHGDFSVFGDSFLILPFQTEDKNATKVRRTPSCD
ncbi:hypothetical protein Tco_1360714 [Tanacetum coccineum]